MSKTNVLITGPVGTGKTTSLLTIDTSKHPLLVLATEPGIDRILTHGDDCHWHYIAPAKTDWDTLIKNARLVNTNSNEALQKMTAAFSRQEYQQFIDVLTTCSDFNCDVCQKNFGPVDALPENYVFAADGLSGLSIMSMDLIVGGKPVKTQPDWGVAMDNLERLLMKLTSDTVCSFVLISHVDREVDEVTGASKIMVSTLGRKLAPKVPRFFDEVVYCKRDGEEFWWSTTEAGVEVKSRRLPLSDEIKPDFERLLSGD